MKLQKVIDKNKIAGKKMIELTYRFQGAGYSRI
jgi:hypothetical protein